MMPSQLELPLRFAAPNETTDSQEKPENRLNLVDQAREKTERPETTTQKIKFDNGKSYEFVTGSSGKVLKLTIEGTGTYTRRGDSDVWDTAGGQWNGEIELNRDGSYSYRERGKKEKQTLTKDGRTISENDDGSSIATKAGQVAAVTRPDKSKVEITRAQDGSISSFKDSVGEWTRKDAQSPWVCKESKEERTELNVGKDGSVSYKDAAKTKTTINLAGRIVQERADGARLELADRRVEKIKRATGTEVSCEYKNGELVKLTLSGQYTYSRPDGSTTNWTYSDGTKQDPWTGQIEVRNDGTCLYKKSVDKNTETVDIAGKRWLDLENGAKITLDKDRNPLVVTRTDGSTAECEYKNGKLNKVVETAKSGSKMTWTDLAGDNRFYSMEYIGAQRINLSVSAEGVVKYENSLGSEITTASDYTQVRKKEDGTTISFDAERKISEIKKVDGTVITPTFAAGNKLATVSEKDSTGRATWTRDMSTDNWTTPDKDKSESRRQLRLSGDGGISFVALKDGQVSSVRYMDGSQRDFERTNGDITKVTERGGSAGTVTWEKMKTGDLWTNGNRQEVRKDVAVTADGQYSFRPDDQKRQIYELNGTEAIEPASLVIKASDEVEKSGTKLWKAFENEVKDATERAEIRKDMEQFVRRAKLFKLTDQQVVETFNSVREIVEADDKTATLKKAERIGIATDLLSHVARPRTIDQGYHDTCNVTTIQVVTAAKEPQVFANVVKDIATKGKYKTSSGTELTMDAESLKPDWEAKSYKAHDPSKASGRSFASQLFQVATVNAYYRIKTTDRRYAQHSPADPKDTGERLFDRNNGSVVSKKPELTNEMLIEAGKQIGSPVTIVENSSLTGSNTVKVGSEQDLKLNLTDLQQKGKLPVVLMVHTRNEPYWKENGSGRSGSNGGWHVVTVWDVDQSGRALVDNQWGRDSDFEGFRRMSMSELYGTTISR